MGLKASGALLLHLQLRGDRRPALKRAEPIPPTTAAFPRSCRFVEVRQRDVPLWYLSLTT